MARTILATWGILCVFLVLTAVTAQACPSGSRFSGYNGNGICVYNGQGLATAVHCQIAGRLCPKGTTREHSGSDPNRSYCCPLYATEKKIETCVYRGTTPLCDGECAPGERFVTYSAKGTMGCVTGHLAYCCF